MDWRRLIRYTINWAALLVALLQTPQFAAFFGTDTGLSAGVLASILAFVAVANKLLSYLRPLADGLLK